jgi:hypothetical protein
MARPLGFDRGTTFTGPLWIKRKSGSREYKDRLFAQTPRLTSSVFEDFVGPTKTFELVVPLKDVTNDAHTILTGANSRARVKVPRAGRLIAAHLIAEDALATHADNHLTFTVTNELGSGSGTAEMLSTTTGANTTDSDLASAVAITAKTGRAFTISGTAASLRVAAGDHILITATVGGTLANAVDLPVFILTFATLPDTVVPKITRTAGSPLVGPVDDTACGEAICQLSATSEANVAGFDREDNLMIDPTKGPIFTCRLKISGAAANTRFIWGLGSAYNATFDSVTSNCWFRIEGNDLTVLAESDDGTTDSDDQDCGVDLVAATYNTFKIDMTDLANIEFWVDDNRVKTLDASALTASTLLQPCFYIQKSTGTGEQSMTIDYWSVEQARAI